MTPGEIRATYKVHRKIIGGGWLYLKPGHVTDDTEMSIALGGHCLRAGQWDRKGIAENFLAWMRSKPVDIGSTCRRGIRDYMNKGQLETPYNEWDAGNGAAMRMAPVALFTLGDEAQLARCAIAPGAPDPQSSPVRCRLSGHRQHGAESDFRLQPLRTP